MTNEKFEIQENAETKIQNSSLYGTPYDVETGEVKPQEIIVSETSDYRIVQLPNGEFKKNMKYHQYFSRKPETEEEQIELYNVFNDENSELVTPLKNMIGKEISLQHVFIQPYQSFDEKTGTLTDGVTTTIQDAEGKYFATSSKTVYYKLKGMFEAFGNPSAEGFKPIKLKVIGTKRQNGVQIDLQLLGRL